MSKCYVSYHNITSNLGTETSTVFENLKQGLSGIKLVDDPKRFYKSFYGAVLTEEDFPLSSAHNQNAQQFTRLEKMLIASLSKTIETSGISLNSRVGLIISSTKGNIDLLDPKSSFPKKRAYLSVMGKIITDYFGFKNEAIIVSNACISGLLAISVAKRYLQEKQFDHIFIVAGDLVSNFVLSGFNAFQALSPNVCKPYDQNRDGINLGEVAISALITSSTNHLSKDAVEILGDASRNDANHISGPSRSGEGVYRSVQAALQEAHLAPENIDYISAHGTATKYNDDMEAQAFNRLGLGKIPLNSFKGYFGHTLGASGLLETILGMQSLHQNILIATAGFEHLGVAPSLNVISESVEQKLDIFLKTASGFGGCNAALIFKKM